MAENNTRKPPMPTYPTGLKARGKRLWRGLHGSADFSESPETWTVIEEACYLADEVERLRQFVRSAGTDTRVAGYNGQPASMPEVDDLRKSQNLLLSMLKSIRVDAPGNEGGKMSRSQAGQAGANARWHG